MENSCGECGKIDCPYCEDAKRIKQLQKANPEFLNSHEKILQELQELHDKTWWSYHDLLRYRMANDALSERMIQNNKSGKSLLQIFRSL
jgi:uncharacterized coiled-coil DUF342 family protein